MSTLVSIIIPIYNLENYIENCLNSVVNQTYRELEILCIDDGGTDKSAEKIKAFAERDSRVKYLYQENAGVSAARNKGLDEATGEYVMFVDGDDYIHFQAVEILLKEITQSGYDMVCANYIFTSILNEKMVPIDEFTVREISISEIFGYEKNSFLYKSVCSKIIKSSVAKQITFPINVPCGEDRIYMVLLSENKIKIGYTDLDLYYYFNRSNSETTSGFKIEKFSITKVFDELCERFENSSNRVLKAHCLQYIFQTILSNRTQAIGTDCEKIVTAESKRIGKKWIKPFIKNKDIPFLIRGSFTVFFYSRHIYEFVRGMQDPTMFDFYKRRHRK